LNALKESVLRASINPTSLNSNFNTFRQVVRGDKSGADVASSAEPLKQ